VVTGWLGGPFPLNFQIIEVNNFLSILKLMVFAIVAYLELEGVQPLQKSPSWGGGLRRPWSGPP
jgi:hypothetical protein